MLKISFLYTSLFLVFLFRLFTHYNSQKNYYDGQKIDLTAVLSVEPQIFGRSQRFEIDGIKVIVSRYPLYHYGDKLEISGVFERKKTLVSSQSGNLLKDKKNDSRLYSPQIKLIAKGNGGGLLGKIILLRQKLVDTYQEFLPESAAVLMSGMVLGVKVPANQNLQDNLRKAGLTHVIVASGLNITLVAGFLSGFSTLFLKRKLSLPLVAFGIVFYTLLAGFEAPIVRAAVMGILALISQAFGRQNLAILSLIFAGLLMLIISPLLVFDLGFQLSFLATSGLILVKPIIEKCLGIRFLGRIPLLGESLVTTLSAQLTTFPLILATFGYYSWLSLLANAFILWTVPWIMGFGGLAGVIGLLIKPLGQALALISYPLLFYFEKMAALFAQINLFSFETQSLSPFLIIAYFFLLTSGLLWLKKEQEKING